MNRIGRLMKWDRRLLQIMKCRGERIAVVTITTIRHIIRIEKCNTTTDTCGLVHTTTISSTIIDMKIHVAFIDIVVGNDRTIHICRNDTERESNKENRPLNSARILTSVNSSIV